jgi:hypothetical protein
MSEPLSDGLMAHATITKAFNELLDALRSRREGAALFNDLAARIRRHIAYENPEIAKFAAVDPSEAKALLREHAAILATLEQLGLRAQVGSLSELDVHSLKVRMFMHEAREETGLYRWLNAPPPL